MEVLLFISVSALLIAGGISLILGLTSDGTRRTGRERLRAIAVALFGVMVPSLTFLLTLFASPEWKGAAELGWIDCFHFGKIALVPLMFWASTALMVRDVPSKKLGSTPGWVAFGFTTGAVISIVCLLHGFVLLWVGGEKFGRILATLFIPFYASVWYLSGAFRTAKEVQRPLSDHLSAFLKTLPFWGLSIFLSISKYKSLPSGPPTCFVVTAASRGHSLVVGPFVRIERNNTDRIVTRQLGTFWTFEALWQRRSPGTHRFFRTVYNRVGPVIARCIAGPLRADITCIALKPAEMAATLILRIASHFEGHRTTTSVRTDRTADAVRTSKKSPASL